MQPNTVIHSHSNSFLCTLYTHTKPGDHLLQIKTLTNNLPYLLHTTNKQTPPLSLFQVQRTQEPATNGGRRVSPASLFPAIHPPLEPLSPLSSLIHHR
ncbi:hypothetical protein Hanom_Chr16g01477781 [Helianthus anomalus]